MPTSGMKICKAVFGLVSYPDPLQVFPDHQPGFLAVQVENNFWLGDITNCTNAFAGIGNPALVVYDFETAAISKTHVAKEPVNGTVWGVRYHPNGYGLGYRAVGAAASSISGSLTP
jgi:hypothetical protein